MSKKYKLVKDSVLSHNSHKLYRIKALKDFSDVKKGDLGGYIESESNLSQEDSCWVYDNAKVYGNAKVCWFAKVYGSVELWGNAWVSGNAKVSDSAWVGDNATVSGNAKVFSYAKLFGYSRVSDNAKVFDNAEVSGNAEIAYDAQIKSSDDYLVFKNTWSSRRNFTYTKSNKMWKVGCFYGTGKELVKKAYKDSKESGDKYKATVQYAETIMN